MAHANTLKRRQRMEQIDLGVGMEAVDAEVSVLQTLLAEKDGMESYVEKQERKLREANPNTSHKEVTENKITHVSVPRVEQTKQEDENRIAHASVSRVEQNKRVDGKVHAAENSILQILQKQNQISELLLQQQRANQLTQEKYQSVKETLQNS